MELPFTNDQRVTQDINAEDIYLQSKKESLSLYVCDFETPLCSEHNLEEVSSGAMFNFPLHIAKTLELSIERERTTNTIASYFTSSEMVGETKIRSQYENNYANEKITGLSSEVIHMQQREVRSSLCLSEINNSPNTMPLPTPSIFTEDVQKKQRSVSKSLQFLVNNCSHENLKSESLDARPGLRTKSSLQESDCIEVHKEENIYTTHIKNPSVFKSRLDSLSNSESEVYCVDSVTLPVFTTVDSKEWDSGRGNELLTNPQSLVKPESSFKTVLLENSPQLFSSKIIQSKPVGDGTSRSAPSLRKESCKTELPLEEKISELTEEVQHNKIDDSWKSQIILSTESSDNLLSSRTKSKVKFADLLDRTSAMFVDEEDFFSEQKEAQLWKNSLNRRFILTGILESTPNNPNNGSVFSKIWPINQTHSMPALRTKPTCENTPKHQKDSSQDSFYWEQLMRQATTRRRSHPRNKRKWGKQTFNGIIREIKNVGNVMEKKSYWTVFRFNNGRTNPWHELVLSLIWTTIFLCLHKNYLDWGTKFLGLTIDPWFSSSFLNYFSIALGFLLYMQADVSSTRWWEGRVHWQKIIENSKRLAVLLNTHLGCLRLSKTGTRMIMAYIICVRNSMQDKGDQAWRHEILAVLDKETVDGIMKQPRRLRYLGVLYGFQRLVQVCIEHRLLNWQVIRDINPTIISMSKSVGTCNRVRTTKLPWVIAMHLQFMLFVYIAVLPMTLVEVWKHSQWEFVALTKINFVDIYIYVIISGYAFFGLSRMALDIDNPFSFTRENHSFGFWGFYEFWSVVEIENLRKIFGFRTKKTGPRAMSGDGVYGCNWVRSKLKNPIEKLINSNLSESHNLYGRTEQIRQQLIINSRTTYNCSHLNLTDTDDEFSSFTLASCSETEDLAGSPFTMRRSISNDRTKRHNIYFADRVLNFTMSLPVTPPIAAKSCVFLK